MQIHKKLKARILSLALSAAMVTTMMPATVFATEGDIALGASSLDTSTVGEIQSFDKLADRFIPSVGENAPSHVYGLSVALNTPFEDLNLPTELTAMVAKIVITPAVDKPVVDSGKTDEPTVDEVIPDEDKSDENVTVPDEDTDDTVSDNQPASPSDAKEEVKEEIKDDDVPLAPEPEQDEETVVTTVKQETIPVTWQSNKEYKSNKNGKFIYTAVIPEDYILADGVSLPQIYVMVGRQARAGGSAHDIGKDGNLTLTTDDGCAVDAPHVVTGTTTTNYINVQTGEHWVTLDGVNIDVSSGFPFSMVENPYAMTVNLVLADGTSNTLKNSGFDSALMVPVNGNLVIGGTGSLTANGGKAGAGIGVDGLDSRHDMMYDVPGKLTINSGTIIATGGFASAELGCVGGSGTTGHITINGGNIIAIGNNGIGGADDDAVDNESSIVKISDAAQVVAVASTVKSAIMCTNSDITPDSGTVANLMVFDFASKIPSGTTIAIKDSNGQSLNPAISYTSTTEFQSIAFSAPATGNYTVYQGSDKLKYTKDGTTADAFAVAAGLNKYADVLGPDVTIAKAVTIVTAKPASGANIPNDSNPLPTGVSAVAVTWADAGGTAYEIGKLFSEKTVYKSTYVYTAKVGYVFDSTLAATDITVTNIGAGTRTATVSADQKTLTVVVTWPETLERPPYTGTEAPAPSATPTSKTETSIRLTQVTVNGKSIEYAKSTGSTAPTSNADWQTETAFNNLTKGTTYYFFARVRGNTTHKAGAVSAGTAITTDGINFLAHDISTGTLDISFDFDNVADCTLGCSAANPHVVTGTTTSNHISILGGTHYIKLENVSITSSTTSPITLVAGAANTITLTGTNNLTSTATGKPGIEQYRTANGLLTIEGEGTLNVQGGSGAAGIGSGNDNKPSGIIVIDSGTVNATGGDGAAGIGFGSKVNDPSDAGDIIINDGIVTATGGGSGAAGIGGGSQIGKFSQAFPYIIINDGIVTAISTGSSADEAGSDAYVGTNGVGIGCGSSQPVAAVEIKGGTVTAKGAGAAIGTGDNGRLILTAVEAKYNVGSNSYTGATNIMDNRIYAGTDQTTEATDIKIAAPTLVVEQFTLPLGDTYYFDLSGEAGTITFDEEEGYVSEKIGIISPASADKTLHYVPFTYAGTVNAYSLDSSSSGDQNASENAVASDRSLFVARAYVSHNVSWDSLNTNHLIFGKTYSTNYMLRSLSGGNRGDTFNPGGAPINNEWDTIWGKTNLSDFYENDSNRHSWTQDTNKEMAAVRIVRGGNEIGYWSNEFLSSAIVMPNAFRPALEVLNVNTLGKEGLKAVELDLNGGKFNNSTSNIKIICAGNTFTAPSEKGLTRPDGDTDTGLSWNTLADGSGTKYAVGVSVPNTVTKLYARWGGAPDYTGTQASAPSSTPVSKTDTTITLAAVEVNGETIEYAKSTSSTAPTADADWQIGTAFTGLAADTQYYFFARVQANASHKVGAASAGTAIKTDKSDAQKVANAKAAAVAALNSYTATNATADADIMTLVNTAIFDAGITGVTAAWKAGSGFNKTNATTSATGSVTGTITLTLNSSTADVTVNLTIAKLTDKAALTAKIDEANNAKRGITVSDNAASSVASGTKFVTTAEMKALTDAIAAAEAVANNPASTTAQMSAAVTTLNSAVSAFNAAIKTGTYVSSGGGSSSSGQTILTSIPPAYTGGTKIIGNVRVPDYTVEGSWKKNENGTWTFSGNQGQTYANTWAPVFNPYANVPKGQSAFDWFMFDANGNMMTGWYTDVDGNTYYLNPNFDNTLGAMQTGWVTIDGKHYYFNENPDGTRGKLFRNTRTPDGYLVDENGVWDGSEKR